MPATSENLERPGSQTALWARLTSYGHCGTARRNSRLKPPFPKSKLVAKRCLPSFSGTSRNANTRRENVNVWQPLLLRRMTPLSAKRWKELSLPGILAPRNYSATRHQRPLAGLFKCCTLPSARMRNGTFCLAFNKGKDSSILKLSVCEKTERRLIFPRRFLQSETAVARSLVPRKLPVISPNVSERKLP